jgi:hypothetical protein
MPARRTASAAVAACTSSSADERGAAYGELRANSLAAASGAATRTRLRECARSASAPRAIAALR